MKSTRSGQTTILGGQSGQGQVDVDPSSRGLVGLDAVHRWVHRGYMFDAWNYNAALGSGAALEILIVTAASHGIHARFAAAAGGDALLTVFENPTVSNNGVAVVPMNRNRSSARTALGLVYKNPTIAADGVQIGNTLLPGGDRGQTGGGGGSSFEEFILAPSTKYLFRLTNLAVGAEPADLDLHFYEPE